MGQSYGPGIITKDLILCTDAADLNSTYAKMNTNDIVTELAFTTANTGTEERIEAYREDPWGKTALLDRSINNDTGSGYDGGDTGNVYNVTNSVKHRFTYWFRVDRKGNDGRLYFGLYGYNSSTQNIGVFSSSGTGTANTNPYFSYPMHNWNGFVTGRWYMFVAYVHPEGSTNVSDSTAGFYDMVTKEKNN